MTDAITQIHRVTLDAEGGDPKFTLLAGPEFPPTPRAQGVVHAAQAANVNSVFCHQCMLLVGRVTDNNGHLTATPFFVTNNGSRFCLTCIPKVTEWVVPAIVVAAAPHVIETVHLQHFELQVRNRLESGSAWVALCSPETVEPLTFSTSGEAIGPWEQFCEVNPSYEGRVIQVETVTAQTMPSPMSDDEVVAYFNHMSQT